MTHSTKRFTFSSKTRTFVAELSDFGSVSPFRQIFQDSCDLGLTLHSHITGKELDFVINRTERNEEDNSVVAEHLVLTPASARTIPAHLRDLKVVLFND